MDTVQLSGHFTWPASLRWQTLGVREHTGMFPGDFCDDEVTLQLLREASINHSYY